MHEILNHLGPEARVLDLGSRGGSFDAAAYPFQTVRVDLEATRAAAFVQADAGALPFRDATFHAVISNHSLEHFRDLDAALREIGRVVERAGALFIAAPDARTFTDRLYRWLARGGGHVNLFRSAEDLASRIERATGLPHAGTRVLYTSLSFLNPRNRVARAPRKLVLLAGGREPVLVALNYVLRTVDRLFGMRWSVYGWALYFGRTGEPVCRAASINVCARCGAGHPAAVLAPQRWFVFRRWACPACGAKNLFVEE